MTSQCIPSLLELEPCITVRASEAPLGPNLALLGSTVLLEQYFILSRLGHNPCHGAFLAMIRGTCLLWEA